LTFPACAERQSAPGADTTTTSSDTNAAPSEGTGLRATTGAKASDAEALSYRELIIPAGTTLPIALDTAIASDTSRVEQPVQAHLTHAVTVDGVTALEEGSQVNGVVTEAVRSGKVKGRAHVAVRFDSLVPRGEGERYDIQTADIGRTAASTKKEDALKIGIPAAGGAIIGGIVGGKKGAAIGAAAGGGGGTAVVLSTRGDEVRLGKGAAMTLRLVEPLTVRVKG
jgi:hypothetical protein